MASQPGFDPPPPYSSSVTKGQYPPPPVGGAPYPPGGTPYPQPGVTQPSYQGTPTHAPTVNVLQPVPEITVDDVQPLLGGFNDMSIRLGFIRKVYGILTVQLAVTIAIICLFTFSKDVQDYVVKNLWVFWTAIGLVVVCLIVLTCCGEMRKMFPYNLIFLGIFTICEGVMLGIVGTTYEPKAVLTAVGITCVVVFALTLFAFQTKIDFTVCGAGLYVTLWVFVLFGFMMIFFRDEVTNMIYASLGALIFCLYLVFDTQMMLGGKHKYAISPEEYIFAALNLYLDIINLFLYILMLVGGGKK